MSCNCQRLAARLTGFLPLVVANSIDSAEYQMGEEQKMVEILSDSSAANSLGTLATLTALVIETGHATGLLRSFLMKKVKARFRTVGRTVGDEGLMVGMARGGASITEIKAAIEAVQFQEDQQNQGAVREVVHEAIALLHPVGDGTMESAEIMVSLGGGKGIPFGEGVGWQWFVYNLGDGSLTTGAKLHMHATYWGVWL